MKRCSGIKPNSGRCERIVSSEQEYCYSHDPARQNERKRNAARGGRAKASGEIGAVKVRLQALADVVEEGQMDRADAAVISQIWGTYIRAVGMELRVREQLELIERVEELERVLEQRGGGRYGA